MKEKAGLKDYIYFSSVMLVFIAGMILLMIYKMKNPWLWGGYIILWTWVEMKVAKRIHLSWWAWGLIILALSGLDIIIINLLN